MSLSNRSNVTLTPGGLSSPASASPLAASVVGQDKKTQPVTDHYVASQRV